MHKTQHHSYKHKINSLNIMIKESPFTVAINISNTWEIYDIYSHIKLHIYTSELYKENTNP